MEQDLGAPAPPEGHRLSLRFVGSGSEYFRIWIVNLLLTLVTLGLYYPFAKVRRLRYFHGATEVDGHPLAFHADPWKMLRGYLLVGALLGAYSLAGQVSATAGLVAFVMAAALWPALWHSSLRFRLANTAWRGIRLHFTGARPGAYVAMAPGLALAFVVLGLGGFLTPEQGEPPRALFVASAAVPLLAVAALPAMLWLLRRYQHMHYALGGEHTRFSARLTAFYGIGLRGVGVAMAAGLLCAALTYGLLQGVQSAASDEQGQDPAIIVRGVVVLLLLFLAYQAVVGPYITARLQNLVWNSTRSEHLHFESALSAMALVRLTALNWLLVLCTLGLYLPYAAVATARLRLQAVSVRATLSPDSLLPSGKAPDESAAGDAAGDLAGIDIGL